MHEAVSYLAINPDQWMTFAQFGHCKILRVAAVSKPYTFNQCRIREERRGENDLETDLKRVYIEGRTTRKCCANEANISVSGDAASAT